MALVLPSGKDVHAEGAADYPTKLITHVVPVPPGGLVDMIARSLGERLAMAWGQSVIVRNMPGGNFQIGVTNVAKSANNGYTLLVDMEAAFVINPQLYKTLSYDPVKDFTPISGLVYSDNVLLAHPSFPVNNVGKFIEMAKKRPGEMNYGSFGIRSASYLNMVMVETMTGVNLIPIDYKGGGSYGHRRVVASHVPIAFRPMALALPLWKSGKIKILGVLSPNRLAYAPELPTLSESGLPGFQARPWFGLFVPNGTPQDIISKINEEVQQILADPEFKKNAVTSRSMEMMASSPEQLTDCTLNSAHHNSACERNKDGRLPRRS